MFKRIRRKRVKLFSAYVLSGAFLMAIGPVCSMLGNVGVTAFNFGGLLDDEGTFLGFLSPCGRENILVVNEFGVPQGNVQFAEDDIIVDCPFTQIVVPGGGGGAQ